MMKCAQQQQADPWLPGAASCPLASRDVPWKLSKPLGSRCGVPVPSIARCTGLHPVAPGCTNFEMLLASSPKAAGCQSTFPFFDSLIGSWFDSCRMGSVCGQHTLKTPKTRTETYRNVPARTFWAGSERSLLPGSDFYSPNCRLSQTANQTPCSAHA